MKREELIIGDSVEKAASWITTNNKTKKLIELMAKEDIAWREEDIKRAITETETFDFSISDITYIRALNNDKQYMFYKNQLEATIEAMRHIPTARRKGYFDLEIKPINDKISQIETEWLETISGCLFYNK